MRWKTFLLHRQTEKSKHTMQKKSGQGNRSKSQFTLAEDMLAKLATISAPERLATEQSSAMQAGREWLAYTYAGELPSSAFGFNDAGIAFSLNAVFPSKPLPVGLARNLASRSLLDADSLEDALRQVQCLGPISRP